MGLKNDLVSKFDKWIEELASKGGEDLHRITRLRANIEHFAEGEDADILESIERLGNTIVSNSK